jgi:hypothetical protein
VVFKKDLMPLTKKGKVVVHNGKGSQRGRMLPSRAALPAFTRPGATINDYSKATPGLEDPSPSVMDFDQDNDGM